MPIKDFEGRGRIPRLGKIRLGERVKGEKSDYPKAVDHFVCPIEVRAVYGENPKKLQIAFHADKLEEVFPQYYKRYGKSTGLVCKGDGEIANCINPETGEFEEIECLGRDCDYYKKDRCKAIGNLYFMIRGVKRFGVYQLDTSSYNSILNINGGIEYAKKLTSGRLATLPFILQVLPQEVNPEGKKKTVYVLHLEADIPKMMKALDSKPQDILSLDVPGIPEEKNIEEDLHKESLVKSIKPVTEKQIKRYYAMVKETGIDPDKADARIKEKYGVEHKKDLTMAQIDEIFEGLEKKIEDRKEQDRLDKEFDESEQGKLI